MTVAEELVEMQRRTKVLRQTECAGCGHWFAVHYSWKEGRCMHDRPPRCRCKRFVDPSEVLRASGLYEETEEGTQ